MPILLTEKRRLRICTAGKWQSQIQIFVSVIAQCFQSSALFLFPIAELEECKNHLLHHKDPPRSQGGQR